MEEKTNAEVLGEILVNFKAQEDFIQEEFADYIACPSSEDCEYDGLHNDCCTKCKVQWLLSKWEG